MGRSFGADAGCALNPRGLGARGVPPHQDGARRIRGALQISELTAVDRESGNGLGWSGVDSRFQRDKTKRQTHQVADMTKKLGGVFHVCGAKWSRFTLPEKAIAALLVINLATTLVKIGLLI